MRRRTKCLLLLFGTCLLVHFLLAWTKLTSLSQINLDDVQQIWTPTNLKHAPLGGKNRPHGKTVPDNTNISPNDLKGFQRVAQQISMPREEKRNGRLKGDVSWTSVIDIRTARPPTHLNVGAPKARAVDKSVDHSRKALNGSKPQTHQVNKTLAHPQGKNLQGSVPKTSTVNKTVIHSRTSLNGSKPQSHQVNKAAAYSQTRSNTTVLKTGIVKIINTAEKKSPGQGQEGHKTNKNKVAQVKKPHKVSKDKYLIYLCDASRSCGGWGDRQRGLVSTFVLAIVTGRKFGVVMTTPCDISKFYVPNEVNWIVPVHELEGRSNVTVDDMDDRKGIMHSITKDGYDFNKEFPQDVMYLRTNVEYVYALKTFKQSYYSQRLPDWANKSVSITFRRGWLKLMKPSTTLQKELKDFMATMTYWKRTRPLVCAHVRLGRSNTIDMDTEIRTPMSAMPVLWEFLQPYIKKGSKFFLATDSYVVRDMARDKFGDSVHDTGGTILHVDKQASWPKACEAQQTALLDQLVLTKCDVLVTSRSIFSQRAAAIRGTTKSLFILYPRKVRKMILV